VGVVVLHGTVVEVPGVQVKVKKHLAVKIEGTAFLRRKPWSKVSEIVSRNATPGVNSELGRRKCNFPNTSRDSGLGDKEAETLESKDSHRRE